MPAGGDTTVIIGDQLRAMREEKQLSQGDIEKRTGLLRCYISRVENGHTVPAIETLEKMARALEVPMYRLFYDGEKPPELPNLPRRKSSYDISLGQFGEGWPLSQQAPASAGQDRRRQSQADTVHGPENGRHKVSSSSGGEQLIPGSRV
jgi:transcriptional regulator with XRE-family HTH domain